MNTVLSTARRLAVALPLCAAAATAFAAPGPLNVSHCWVRAMPASLPSGAFFDIENSGATPAELTGVASPAFGMAMLHQTTSNGSMSTMSMVEKAAVPAHGKLAFAPGGYHVMLEDAKAPLAIGSTIALTLSFADGRKVTAQCKVESPKALSH